jgi:BA14K-like protein
VQTACFGRRNAVDSAHSVHAAYSSILKNSDRAQLVRGLGNDRPLNGLDHMFPEMEPTMINLKVLSAAAAIALVLPLVVPTESSAQAPNAGGRGGGAAVGGGGGGGRGGGAPAAIGGGGGFRGGGPAMGGGARFSAAPSAAPNAGVAVGGPRIGGGAVAAGPRYAGSGNWQGGNWQGGNWQGGGYRHRRGGFWPGVAVGAAIGGSYAYYGSPGYYDQGYYDDSYYDDSSVAVVPSEGGDEAYCRQTYRSWDPASRTYLGYDGQRYPCP